MAVPYTAVVVVCALVLSLVVGAITATITGIGMLGAGVLRGAAISSSSPGSSIQFDKDSPIGKLQALGNKLEESNKVGGKTPGFRSNRRGRHEPRTGTMAHRARHRAGEAPARWMSEWVRLPHAWNVHQLGFLVP